MKGSDMTDEALVAFLREHPDLRNRVASMALAVENADGDLGEADAAEERLVEEMQHLGREALQEWAKKRVEVTEQEIRQQPSMHRQGKKNSAGTRNSAR
jgi:membrane-bound ClpP family serine protease